MLKIFVVEDHAVFRKVLIALLEKEPDFNVCGEASSGTEAFELLKHITPDLILVDISMPGMSGFDFLQKVQSCWPDLPCIILSGHLESIYVDQVEASQVRAYIDKADVREIVPKIRQVMPKLNENADGGTR